MRFSIVQETAAVHYGLIIAEKRESQHLLVTLSSAESPPMLLATRLLAAAVTALTLAAVPIYPGAAYDAAASKEASAGHPQYPYKVYVTPDSYEKVVAFYKSKGAQQSMAVSVGNSATQKMAMFSSSDSTIAINWPADVRDKSGKVIARSGTRIAIGS
jgi:hypothetical protein